MFSIYSYTNVLTNTIEWSGDLFTVLPYIGESFHRKLETFYFKLYPKIRFSIKNIFFSLNQPYLVINSLAITVNLNIEKFEQSWWEKLKVLHVGLFWRTGRFRCFGFVDTHQLLEVCIHGVVGFTFTFRRFDPVRDSGFVVRLTEVLSLKLVDTVGCVHGEILECILTQVTHFLCQLFCLKNVNLK